jgi:hypothetical protein
VIDVGGQRSERRKWLSTFDCVTAVIFCVAISDYDQGIAEQKSLRWPFDLLSIAFNLNFCPVLREDRTQNRMKEALVLFEEIVNSQVFHKIDFIVFFNKIDLFAEKLSRSSPAVCFPVWSQLVSVAYCGVELPHYSRARSCPPVDRATISGGEESSGASQGVPSLYVRHWYDSSASLFPLVHGFTQSSCRPREHGPHFRQRSHDAPK